MTGRRLRFSVAAADDDPLTLVPNLFDVAIILAVAFLVAALSVIGRKSDIVQRPGRMQDGLRRAANSIQPKSGGRSLDRPTARKAQGHGTRLGVAYQLENGEIIYVPD
jgi:hypothetical protein